MNHHYPRDLVGYGSQRPLVKWQNNARIALSFVLNYEEGGENCILHGDQTSEAFLSEIVGADKREARHISMESIYEYGSRAGVWRLLDLFRSHQVPLTIFAVAEAMLRHQKPIEQCLKDGHEVISHGLKWIDYQYFPIDDERSHMQKAIEIHKSITGSRPLGWYTGRTSPNTRALVAEEGGFVYDSDDYSDDLPFWSRIVNKPHLIVPYTLDTNDMRFATAQGFHNGEQFFQYLKDAFDCLYFEGQTEPKMLSIGLHCRLIGRPGRMMGLKRFIEYAQKHDRVWFARRIEIANLWRAQHPYPSI